MARVSTPTLLSLDEYADIIGLSPVHFNQILCEEFPETPECRDIWTQYAWMLGDKASREDLGRAIAQAEELIANHIGYWPAPHWLNEEVRIYPQQRRVSDGDLGIMYYPALSYMRYKTVEAKWGHFSAPGRRRALEIESGATVNYTDPNLDGWDELATVVVTYSDELEESEVALFQTSDTSPEKRIRPLNVSISGNTVTITGHAALFVDSLLWETKTAVDGDDPNSFLSEVEVYRVYTEDQGEDYAPVVLQWQVGNSLSWAEYYGIIQGWRPDPGILTIIPAAWDSDDLEWDVATWSCLEAEPHRAKIWYRAGWEAMSNGKMREPYARAVAALATSLLVKPICGCGRAEKLSDYWRHIPNPSEGIAYNQLVCPFGPQRGAWEAFNVCVQHDTADGFSL